MKYYDFVFQMILAFVVFQTVIAYIPNLLKIARLISFSLYFEWTNETIQKDNSGEII